MQSIFLSYSRKDLRIARRLQKSLSKINIDIWIDQESIYAGEKWPKAIGEAIADKNAVILLWSKESAASHFVEFEWNTSIALRKNIIPILVDNTPLPPALSALNALFLDNYASVVNSINKSISTVHQQNDEHQNLIIAKLGAIEDDIPEKVIQSIKTVFRQDGWQVQGNVYQVSSGNINIEIKNNENEHQIKSVLSKNIQLTIGIIVSILTAATLVLSLPNKFREFFNGGNKRIDKHSEMEYVPNKLMHTGTILNQENKPIRGAVVKIDLLPGDSVITITSGAFKFSYVPGKAGDPVHLYIQAERYQDYDENSVLGRPVVIKLEKK